MQRIEAIDTIPYDVPLKSTLAWGKGHELAHLNHVLVRVRLSDGSIGIAEATPRPTIYGETQASVQAIIEEHLAPIVVGEIIEARSDIDLLNRKFEPVKHNNTAKGALNIALHAALAQSHEQSLSDYLYVEQDRIRVSYITGTGTDDVVHADVAGVYEAGVRVFKMKIGKRIPQEIALIQRLQSDFPDADFYADANQCLDSNNAVSVLGQLYEMGVLYCEEPLPVHDLKQRHDTHMQTELPLIADDSVFTLQELQREIDFDTFDLVNIKTPRTGFSESWAMAKAARKAGKTIMVGSQASSLLGAMHTALFAASINAEHATECTFFLKTADPQFDAPSLHEGYLSIEDVQHTLDHVIASLPGSSFTQS